MGIIVKFILKNIYEKKFRTFLIVISIILSSALFFASTAMTGTMANMFAERMKQYYGNSDIVIHANEKSPSRFMTLDGIKGFSDKLEYAIGSTQGSAVFKPTREENVTFQLNAFKPDDIQRFSNITYYDESELYPFEGRKIIIGKQTADKYGFKVGDTIELDLRGTPVKFKICALANAGGMFMDETQSKPAIMPLETLASFHDIQGKVSIIYLKVKDPAQKQALIKELSSSFKRYTVREPISIEELKQQMASMTVGFMLMTTVVIVMSVFIIYTSFKVVMLERLPVIGTFRSIGATRKTTDKVMLAESLIYGIVGGAVGCLLGLGILYIMAFIQRPVGVENVPVTIAFSPGQLITAFILAVVLSFVSTVIPIVKISKIPIKDIVLNVMEKALKKSVWKLAFGIIMLAAALVLPFYTPNSLALPVNSVCMFLSIIAMVLLIPYITSVFVKIFEKLYVIIFGNIGLLAAKNLRENKSILNNISLLAIGISSLLMINTISNSVVKEVANVYRNADFGIWMHYISQGNRNLEGTIRQVDGVSGIYGIFEARGIEIDNIKGGNIALVQGIDTNKYLDYWKTDLSEKPETIFKKLNEGKSIILSESIRDKYGLKEGDTLMLRLNKASRPYKIVGFLNTMMYNGQIALVSEMNLKMDTGARFYSNVYIKTSAEPEKVIADLKNKLAQRPHYMMTVKEMEKQNRQSNDSVFIILKGFSIMALVIGVFGILNNLMISFIERRKSLAMLRSIGMDKRQIVRMIFIEAFSGGMVGGITGIVTGFFLIWGIPFVLEAINMAIPLKFPFGEVYGYLIAGILITVAASISPAIKSSKLNIIQAIKYE